VLILILVDFVRIIVMKAVCINLVLKALLFRMTQSVLGFPT